MDDDRFARLTPRQLDCLRLLPIKGSSKGIAEALDIAPGTVDQHLKGARRLLGVSDSWMASELFLAHLRTHPQKLDNQPEPVDVPPQPAATTPGTDDRSEGQSECNGDQGDAPKRPSDPRRPSLSTLLFPSVGRSPNELSIRSRLSLIALETFLAAGAVAILVALVFSMSLLLVVLNRRGG